MKSINGPLQDLWLTRAGGDRPVGTPQFGSLYARLPPTKCLPARKTPLNLPPVSPKGPEMGKIVSPGGGIFPEGNSCLRRLTVEDVVMVLSPSQTTKLESLVRMPSTSNKNKALASMSVPPIFFEILCGLLLSSWMVSAMGHVFPFSIPTHRV